VAVARSPRRGGVSEDSILNGQSHLEVLLEPAISAAGYRLVRLRLMGGKRKTLQVMAERDDGSMDVEDCAALSRALSEVLESADPIADRYVLEVSSPGIDRPLTRPEDFSRFAGHEARVEVAHGLGGRRRFTGLLIGRDGNDIVIDAADGNETSRVRLALKDVTEAKLVLTDRLVRESLKAKQTAHAKASHH
jgi:ribosome maturation factor RimP